MVNAFIVQFNPVSLLIYTCCGLLDIATILVPSAFIATSVQAALLPLGVQVAPLSVLV